MPLFKISASSELHFANPVSEQVCAFLGLANLAETKWYLAPCHVELPVLAICLKREHMRNTPAERHKLSNYIGCDRRTMLWKTLCIKFSKNVTKETVSHDVFENKYFGLKTIIGYISQVNEETLYFCFLSKTQTRKTATYIYNRISKDLHLSTKLNPPPECMFVCIESNFLKSFYSLGNSNNHVWNCTISAELIPMYFYHDNVDHCLDGEDEFGTICRRDGALIDDTNYCLRLCSLPDCHCADLYHQAPGGGCETYKSMATETTTAVKHMATETTTAVKHMATETTTAVKHYEEALNESKLAFPYTDCNQDEIAAFNSLGANPPKTQCGNHDEIPCTHGCSLCFSLSKLCVYETDKHGGLLSCPSGSHLKNCFDTECANMFKCQDAYCVPFRWEHQTYFVELFCVNWWVFLKKIIQVIKNWDIFSKGFGRKESCRG